MLLPRGDVLQTRQVNHQDFPPVVLSRLSKTEILYVDTGAIPNHLRVQVFVLILSKEGSSSSGGGGGGGGGRRGSGLEIRFLLHC